MNIIYVCIVAGLTAFQDKPCVDRPTAAPLVGTIVEFPRYGVDRGGPAGSWSATEGSTVYPQQRHHHYHRGGRR